MDANYHNLHFMTMTAKEFRATYGAGPLEVPLCADSPMTAQDAQAELTEYGKALAEAARENLDVQRRQLENLVAAFNDEGERHVCRFCQQPVRGGHCACV